MGTLTDNLRSRRSLTALDQTGRQGGIGVSGSIRLIALETRDSSGRIPTQRLVSPGFPKGFLQGI